MPTLAEALYTYLQEDRSALTTKQYHLVLSKMAAAIGPDRSITLIRYEDLMDYIARLKDSGIKQSTLVGYTAVIKSFFGWCVDRHYIEISPAQAIKRRSPMRDPTRNRAVPPEELRRMVTYAEVNSPRNYALLLFMVDTGCRVGGLVSLTIQKLDLDEMSAFVLEKGNRWHKALYGEQTANALSDWLRKRPEVDHDYVWTGPNPDHKPLTRQGVAALIRRLALKVEASRLWSPHAIRHSLGHAYANAGIPVTVTQQKMGHSTPQVTMEYYYPDDSAYVAQITRRNELLALKDTAKPDAAPRLVGREQKRSG